MSTITLPNIRVSSDLTVGVVLKDGGVAIDWSTLSNIKAYLYADAQRAMAGRCTVSIDETDSTRLVCAYRANKPQYIGVNRIVITCTYRGETKTYDKPALNFVRWTDDQAGQQITIDDPDVDVEIEVEDVSSSLLDQAIAAALAAAAAAEHAAHLIPNQVLLDAEAATAAANAAADAANAAGITSAQVSIADDEPGTPSADVSLVNKVLSIIFHHLKGNTGDAAGFGTITATVDDVVGDPSVTVTASGPDTAKNFTFAFHGLRGIQGVPGVANAKYKQVDTLPTASAATMDFIYLTPSGTSGVYNMSYTEQDGSTYSWQDLGTTAIQLSDYATKAEVSQLEHKVVNIASGENNLFNPNDKDVLIGKYINASGAEGTGNYNASGYIPVEVGKTYYCSIQDGAGFRFACFYDSSKAVISNSLTWPSRSFTTPSGCAFVRVSFYQAHYNYAQVSPIYGNYDEFIPVGKYIEPLQDRTKSIEQKVGKTSVPFFNNVYIDVSASVGSVVALKGTQNVSWSSTTAKVEEGDIISFRVYGGTAQSGFAFLNADDKLIEKATTGGLFERTIIAPNGAKTLICNSETAQTHFLFVSKKDSLQNLLGYFTNVPKSQLFDRALVEIGYCGTGGWVNSQSTGYVHTPKVDVSKYIGRTICFSVNGVALTSNSFRFITVYDANGVAQPSLGVNSESLNIPTFIVPEGAYNIVISYLNPESSADMAYFQAEFDSVTPFATYELVPELDFSLIKRNVDYEISKSVIPTQVSGNVLQGKKWVACGDSFTHGDFTNAPENNYTIEDGIYQGHYKVYPYLIGNRNDMVIVNEAVNGSTMTYVDGQGFSKSNGRYTQIPSDADYITLKFGINDDADHKGVTIGTIDDNTNETFYGAWNIVMDYLIQNHPQAKIGIIVTNGSTLEIVNAIIAIAEKWGIPYLNEATDKQCSFMFRSNRTDVVSSIRYFRNMNWYVHPQNNAHPNALAHEYESTVIEAWLRTL